MQTPRQRRNQRKLKRFNEWLQRGHDGLRLEQDARQNEESPDLRWLR